jgi:endonuclease/exonuclease/phosphatase family metal-dependent hydrolase
VALTERAQHLNAEAYAIDHLAVSPELVAEPVAQVHRPGWDGRQLSDHATYTAELRMPAPSAQAPATGP